MVDSESKITGASITGLTDLLIFFLTFTSDGSFLDLTGVLVLVDLTTLEEEAFEEVFFGLGLFFEEVGMWRDHEMGLVAGRVSGFSNVLRPARSKIALA